MRLLNVSKALFAGLGLALAPAAFSGVFTQSPDPASVTQGGTVSVNFLFAGDGATEDAQLDLEYNAAVFTTVTPTVVVGGSVCVVLAAPDRLRIVPPSGGGVPLTSTPTVYCAFELTADGAAPFDDYDFVENFIECASPMGAEPCSRSGPFRVSVVDLFGPAVVVNPNGGPQTLSGGTAIGATNSFSFTASSTASPGDVGGPNATINCDPAPAGFTIAPAGLQTFTSGTGSTVNYTSTCERGVADQTGDLTCAVNDQGGARNVVFNLTCLEGQPIPGPTLAFDPNGGPFPLPPGLIGGVANRLIAVNVTDSGDAGGPDSVATCATAPPFTVTGSPVTVSPPAALGTAGNITVSCTRTDVEQNGTVTCNIDGGADVTFAAVCPAGSEFVLPDATPVPTVSNWGLYTLILLTLGLGVGFAYRRLS